MNSQTRKKGTAKKKKNRNWRHSTFYRVYFAALAVALVLIVAGTLWLRGVLEDYESAQPKYVAQEVAGMFERSDYESIYAVDTSAAQFTGTDRDLYLKSLSDMAAGKAVAWEETYTADPQEHSYSVTLDGQRFATFTLVPSGESTPRGNALWKLGSVTTLVQLRQPEPEPESEPEEEPQPQQMYMCRITAPMEYTVIVDGVSLSSENSQVNPKELFEAGFLPEGVVNPPMTEYLYDSPTLTPEIRAVDAGGNEMPVVAEDRELTWTCQLEQDENYRQQYASAAWSLAQKVAKFISGDAGKKSIQKICAKGSPADEIFDNLYNRYTTPHDGISFRNEQITEFYALSEDCFTCHVSFDVVLDTKQGESVDSTAYTFCVIRQGNSGKLYNLLIY